MEDLIQNLKRLREDRNISYIMLERATGIRAAKLREIEEGQQQPTIAELDRLLAFYSITSQQLMRYKGKRQLWLRYSLVAIVLLLAAGIAFFAFGGSLISSQEPGEHDALSNRANEASIAEAGAEQPSDELSERSNGAGSIEDASRSADADAAEVGGDGADGDEALEGAEEASSVSDEEQADQAAAETDTEAEQAAEAEDGASSDASTEPGMQPEHASEDASQSLREAERAIGEGADHPQDEEIVLRFWGNIPYAAERLPALDGNDASHIRHIIPVTQLTDERPEWVTRHPERFILNAGTADIWTSSTINEWRKLREDGVPVIGLGVQSEAYEPYILEAGGIKVGLLSLAGLIHEAEQIALPTRVGLPRAYDNQEVRKAVKAAKSKVDYLFVLIHWGERRGGETPIAKQERLASVIAEAGGDFIIGNRSIRAQQMTDAGGVPVFYSLGRSISELANDGQLNLVLDVHFSNAHTGAEPSKVVLRAGTMRDGVMQFAPLAEDVKQKLQAKFAEAWPIETVPFVVQGGWGG